MKYIKDLIIPDNDSENYTKRSKKDLFNQLFIAKDKLHDVLDSNRYFLIGEKGTGKTAYAVYLSNNDYKNTFSTLKYIRETEYTKFIEMKNSKNLQLSDYESVWKVLLLLLVSQEISNVARNSLLKKVQNLFAYQELKRIINEFTNHAFTPELINAMKLIDNDEFVAKFKNSSAEVGASNSQTIEQQHKYFNLSLLKLEEEFKKAIKNIKLGKNYIVFIDGIDIRPSSISQQDYIECLKGLTNAIWNLNQDYFGNLKDTRGNAIKIMLLIRPDIYMKMDLQNQGTKIYNNSVVLSWLTTYKTYRKSNLFLLANTVLSYNQHGKQKAERYYFDYYFPYTIRGKNSSYNDSAFIDFLRYSFYRARDIITILGLLKDSADNTQKTFIKEDFNNILFDFSQYLLMEIRDYFKFYYEEKDFNFLRNFLLLFHEEVRFDMQTFNNKYRTYIDKKDLPSYAQTAENFLQFLFELNIIGYINIHDDGSERYHWCFRERSMSNPVPQINLHAEVYYIHHGLHASLRIRR
jgi:hypothetical protein